AAEAVWTGATEKESATITADAKAAALTMAEPRYVADQKRPVGSRLFLFLFADSDQFLSGGLKRRFSLKMHNK
ncbi:MAG: hypothetical protein AAGC83_04585, partial [Pseudomonadota bacterium]